MQDPSKVIVSKADQVGKIRRILTDSLETATPADTLLQLEGGDQVAF